MIKINKAQAKTVRVTVSNVEGSSAAIKRQVDEYNLIDITTEAGKWRQDAIVGSIAKGVFDKRKAKGMTDFKAKSSEAVNAVWVGINGGLAKDGVLCENDAPQLNKTEVSRLRTVFPVLVAYLAKWQDAPVEFPLGKGGLGLVNKVCRDQESAEAVLAMIPESENIAGLSAKIKEYESKRDAEAEVDPAKAKKTRKSAKTSGKAKAKAKAKATPASAKPADPATTTESGIPSEAPALAGIATADLLAELAKRVKTAKLTDSEARALGAIWDTQLAI